LQIGAVADPDNAWVATHAVGGERHRNHERF
jgi:hypothetical protein